jgi:mono/diheme cytochrome c family protein
MNLPARLVPLLAVTVLAACGPVFERPGVTGPLVSDDPRAAMGERVFFANCHGCHPHGGEGLGLGVADRPLPNFAVRLQIRNGFGEMPGFGVEEIDDAELDALIVYLNELRDYWAAQTD